MDELERVVAGGKSKLRDWTTLSVSESQLYQVNTLVRQIKLVIHVQLTIKEAASGVVIDLTRRADQQAPTEDDSQERTKILLVWIQKFEHRAVNRMRARQICCYCTEGFVYQSL